jgi:hypothetical protein
MVGAMGALVPARCTKSLAWGLVAILSAWARPEAIVLGAPSNPSASGLAEGAACGDAPLRPCPLNAWMKANTSPAIFANDFETLAIDFEKVASFAPANYQNWSSIAKDGADAARARSLDGVKAACRSCHAQYKDRYKKEMRDRPL